MYHSITIGNLVTTYSDPEHPEKGHFTDIAGKNTWDDWGLIPTSRPLVVPPAPNKNVIAIPGTNGSIDMSLLLTGHMTYQNRSGSWEFIVENKNVEIGPYKRSKKPDDWASVYSEIMSYLHGKLGTCVLEDDPGHYYVGYFSVNSWKSDQAVSSITIDYDLQPFKHSMQSSEEPWLWDPFNFESDYVREIGYWDNGVWYNLFSVGGTGSSSVTHIIQGCPAPVDFKITCSAFSDPNYPFSMSLSINGGSPIMLQQGVNVLNYIYLDQISANTFTFTGNGFVSIDYRAGEF